MEEDNSIIFSLIDLDDFDVANNDYLYKFLTICEKEYTYELRKKDKIKTYQKAAAKQEEYVETSFGLDSKTKEEKEDLTLSHKSSLMDISSYYKDVMDVEDSKEFEIVLPSRTDINFSKVVNTILLKMTKEIEDLHELLTITYDESERDEILSDIDELEDKKEMLTDYRDEYVPTPDENLESNNKPFHLIFVPSESGRNLFLDDIRGADKAFILSGINDLKNGRIKRYKKLLGVLNGIGEIKSHNSYRILIDKIENNTDCFIFILGFINKRCMQNNVFETFSMNRKKKYLEYRNQIDHLIASGNTDDLVREHEKILNEIIDTLESEVKYEKVKKKFNLKNR